MNDSPESDQFVDTNILIYAFDLSAGYKHDIALQMMEKWWESETGCLSIQVLQEFYVTVTRKITPPLELSLARQIVADLAQWRHHTPEADDILQAIDFQQDYQLSFWDALIVQSATRLGCKQLFSEDLSDGQRYGDIQVINPFIR